MASNAKSLATKLLALLVVLVALGYGAYRLFFLQEAIVAHVQAGNAVNAVKGSVVIRADFTMELRSDVAGLVAKSNVEQDKAVKKGDVLYQLDTGDTQLEIERLSSELDAATKRYDLGLSNTNAVDAAKEALAEAERSKSNGLASENELLKAKRNLKDISQKWELEVITNKAAVDSLKNGLEVKKRMLDKMAIKAPFDGVVTKLYVGEHQLIGANEPLARLITVGRIVEGRLSEENFAGVAVGQKALVMFLSYGDNQYPAEVIRVPTTADPDTQRYLIQLHVDEAALPPTKLVPGLTGDVTIVLNTRAAQAIIPRAALASQNRVFVVNDGHIEIRSVKVGYVSTSAVEVLEGLKTGEMVVVAQQDRFSDGMRVTTTPIKDEHWK